MLTRNGIANTYRAVLAACLATIAAASPAGAHDCKCRFFGNTYEQGETVCMRGRITQCGMYLNNSSWNFVAEACPQVGAPPARQLATSIASNLDFGARRR